MFDSLRKSFIRMNMLVISLLMLASFLAVYVLVYTNAQREIESELNMLLELPDTWINAPRAQPHGDDFAKEAPRAPAEPFGGVPRIGFAVRYDESGYEVLQSRMFFVAEEFDIAAMLLEVNRDTGTFAMDEHAWTYRIKSTADEKAVVAFVETSESRALLLDLVKVFAAIAAALLVAIWLVSRWFARRSVAPIEAAYNHQRRFIQDASHDLKTPVAVIKTNLELIASHADSSVASQAEWMGNIEAETARMEHLTAQLLSLARAEADLPKRAETVFCLSDVVRGTALPMEAVLYEKELQFTSEIEDGIMVLGSREDAERLVHILLENAVQYTPAKGTVDLVLRREKKKAVLVVSNTGPGIAQADLPHVFERFYRADAARDRAENSYGLGLAIAHGIVQRHKGEIDVESAPGKDTVFTVRLPMA